MLITVSYDPAEFLPWRAVLSDGGTGLAEAFSAEGAVERLLEWHPEAKGCPVVRENETTQGG